jgi:L-arabinonolactonase
MDAFLDRRHAPGACVLWCERRGRLLWTDSAAATLWSCEPRSGRSRSWPMPERLCSFALTGSDDRLLLGLASGLAFFSFSTGRVQRLCAVEADLPTTRLGQGRCDRQGRFVFGTVDEAAQPKAIGGFYRLNLDLSLERLPIGPAAAASSICFSPDGRRLYFADAASGEIRFAHYNPCSAEVGAVRSFLAADAAPGVPMGATVDADGYLWSARWGAGQVMRFAPDGRLDRAIGLDGAQACALAIGGPELSTLFVTSALRGLALDVHGLPESRFLH